MRIMNRPLIPSLKRRGNNFLLLFIILAFFVSSCGTPYDSSSDSGSIAFSVKWVGASTKKPSDGASGERYALDCAAAGVSTVEANIYESGGVHLASGGPWNCVARSGTVNNVTAGTNRTIRIDGKNSSGAVIYTGTQTGVTVTAGETTPPIEVTVTATGGGGGGASTYTLGGTVSGLSGTLVLRNNGGDDLTVTANGSFTFATALSDESAYDVTVSTQPSGQMCTLSDLRGWITGANITSVIVTCTDTGGGGGADGASLYSSLSCAACHGADGTGGLGPDITTATAADIELAGGTGTMAGVSITSEEATDLATYIATLGGGGGVVVRKVPDTGQTTSHTDTFGEDSDYTINAPSYTDNGDGTITDNITGLMWQKEDDDTIRTWTDAGTYCDGLSFAGYSDWRLPDEFELMGIVNYGTYTPAIDETYFPNTNTDYWSATTFAGDTSYAWYVFFSNGYVNSLSKSNYYYVRCVRGTESTTQSFTDNGDDTVTDNVTGLMWQKEDDDTKRTWESAISYCEGLALAGYSDWRLPNVKELRSILDNTTGLPAINATYFPNTNSEYYWSATTFAYGTSYAWGVNFYLGTVDHFGSKSTNYSVRCVR